MTIQTINYFDLFNTWEGPTTMATNKDNDMDAVGRRIYRHSDETTAVGRRVYHGSDELDQAARRMYGVEEASSLDEQGARIYGAGSAEVNATGARIYGLPDKGAVSHSQLAEHGRQAADRAAVDEPWKLDEVRDVRGGYVGRSLTADERGEYGTARGRYTTQSIDNRDQVWGPGDPWRPGR